MGLFDPILHHRAFAHHPIVYQLGNGGGCHPAPLQGPCRADTGLGQRAQQMLCANINLAGCHCNTSRFVDGDQRFVRQCDRRIVIGHKRKIGAAPHARFELIFKLKLNLFELKATGLGQPVERTLGGALGHADECQ